MEMLFYQDALSQKFPMTNSLTYRKITQSKVATIILFEYNYLLSATSTSHYLCNITKSIRPEIIVTVINSD